MDEDEIKDRIDIIFDKEEDNFAAGIFYEYVVDCPTPSRYSLVTPSKYSRTKLLSASEKELKRYISDSTKVEIKWETYTTLKKLYHNVETNSDSRRIFMANLEKKLVNFEYCRTCGSSSSLAFYFLMKMGKIEESMEAFKIIESSERSYVGASGSRSPPPMYSSGNKTSFAQNLVEDIYIFLHMEQSYFNDSSLIALKEVIEGIDNYPVIPKIKRTITSIRYNKVINELSGTNEEINIDKEQVIDLINKYGFPPEMESFLLELDKIPESEDWGSINSGMIGNLRSFFEHLIKNIAAQINQKTKVPYPTDPSGQKKEMGLKRQYIKEHLILSDEDDKFITAFVKVLHKEGGHALMSERRYFVLTKNIGIELALFLMSKLDSFLSNEQ